MMQVIEINSFGGVEALQTACRQKPEPGAGEVRIAIYATAINPVDYKIRQGQFGGDLPTILGQDLAGVIDAIGQGGDDFRPGDEVCAYLGGPKSNGSYAEYVCVSTCFVCKKPSNLSFAQAAAIPLAGLTAHESVVNKAKVQAGDSVFIAGGSGGVGSMAIQLCHSLGVTSIVATAGGDRSANYLEEELGVPAKQIIRYKQRSLEELEERIKAVNGGKPVNAAFDFAGDDMKRLCCRVIGFEGCVVSIVEEPSDFNLDLFNGRQSPLFARSASFHFEFLAARALFGGPKDWPIYQQKLDALMQLLETGHIKPPAITAINTFSEDSFRTAHTMLEQGEIQGKIVVSVASP